MHADGSGVRLSDDPDIKLFTLVGWGRSFLSVAWPTGDQLLIFFCSSVPVGCSTAQGSPGVERNTIFYIESSSLFHMLPVWCLFVDDRYGIYLVSVDADIDDKQVVYFGLNNFLERMTNHLKIPYILSRNIPKLLENSGFLLKYLCLVKRT